MDLTALLSAGTGPTAPAALTSTVGGLLDELARTRPHATALTSPHGERTFAGLRDAGDRVARALVAAGIGRGDAVALLAPNLPLWLEVMAGAARVGAVLVPLNTFYKDDELRYVLGHSRARLLIAVDQVARQDLRASVGRLLPGLDAEAGVRLRDDRLPHLERVVEIGERRHRGAVGWEEFLAAGDRDDVRARTAEVAAAVEPDDPLYLMYTSGSTSHPKGVLLLHGHALTNAWHIGERQGVEPDDRTWLVQPLFWALGAVNMLFSAWTHGSCVVLQEVFDAGEGLAVLERSRATRAYALGNIAQALLAHPAFDETDLSALRKGVALFSAADRRLAHDRLGMRDVVSVYGSTEMHAVSFSEQHTSPLADRMASNGTLLPGWEGRLVRPGTDEPVEVSPGVGAAVGEILVRGRLAPGYFEDPEQTARAFDADGWLHTGDLVSIDARGRLEFLARTTEMIKTGGINVAPAEVEDVLSGCPGVSSAHVVGLDDAVKGQVVGAVVVPVRAGAVTADDVRAWAAERVARYKVPERVLVVPEDALPRLATGKIARRRLPELLASHPD